MNTKFILVSLAAILPLAINIAGIIICKRKTGARFGCYVIGAICFIVFAMGLEQILHQNCLLAENAISAVLNNSPVLYALYAAFAAGIFEETARLVAYKFLLKKYKDPAVSIMYGIGHGGIEMILVIGSTYLIYMLFMCGVSFGTAEMDATLLATIMSIDNSIIVVALLERFIALALHIGLSIMVFKAHINHDIKWFFIAIAFHVLSDLPAAFYQRGYLSIPIIEIWCAVIAIIVLYIAIRLYKPIRANYLAEKEANMHFGFCLKDCDRCPDETCAGCRREGPKSEVCENLCEMRRCGLDKHINTCEDCPDHKTCGAFIEMQRVIKEEGV